MEALVLHPEWESLFTLQERLAAWKRLKGLDYDPGPKPS